MPSDIQVIVRWKEHTVFAGEDVECVITFKNVADTANADNGSATQRPLHQRRASRTLPTASNLESHSPLKSPSNPFFHNRRRSIAQSPLQKTHQFSGSISSPFGSSHSFPPAIQTPRLIQGETANHSHKRSLSILSIDSDAGIEKTPTLTQFQRQRSAWGHGRSASLQALPKRSAGSEDLHSPGLRKPVPTNSFVGYPSPTGAGNLKVENKRNLRLSRPGSGASSPRGTVDPSRSPNRRTALPLPADFKFPPTTPSISEPEPKSSLNPTPRSNDDTSNPVSALSPKTANQAPKDSLSFTQQPHLAPITRILSSSSINGSARSSGEFYSLSNNSTETMQSEYNTDFTRPSTSSIRHGRTYSSVETVSRDRNTSTLLMGYAQISATFTVDGSLINQAVFEEVKRKGVVGDPGNNPQGMAVANNKPRKNGGLWGAFGLNAIEESLNGLLSGGELNGLRDMRGVASSKSIPLLSTPQSLLFVDLRLSPGEEKSFLFSFSLPRGLPASHKGKAIKFSYNLVIGTQRPSGPKEMQQVNRINVPFRVFSSVNGRGDILGHDLMMPYVLLRDEAKVQKINRPHRLSAKEKSISGPTWTSASDFLNYVDEILEQNQPRAPSLIATPLERNSNLEKVKSLSCKDAIDLAILRSNQIDSSNRSSNRFEIARNSCRIAVVVLNRPAHRLGETLLATIDFADATLPCYSLRATLESSEKVDPSIAVRSNASIHRATRRIHASYFENTLFSTRAVFSPAIPITATPTLLTNGVRLDWELRLEFVTVKSSNDYSHSLSGANLLDTISEDDRGSIFCSLEALHSESFEISIPITVYGETVREPLSEENQVFLI